MLEKNDYRSNLHHDSKASTHQHAHDLRLSLTPAEKKLWEHLRNRKLDGKKFRRQHALDKYVLDFYCHERKLAIEVDGGVHDGKMNKQYDEARTIELNNLGVTVLRFKNEEVISTIEFVLKKISEYLV